ncbi:cobalamin biosynthesis protein [Brucella pituitosa]|uniref:cobalamin biosynthesis protein n=1 Tax=Brucella pituitosa TaxID=571256 RepID=UPI000C278A7B|nr:cobalamin biosynthesis protein [Brucella pituitosa]MCK4203555.1 cobalamin biosynthesis protein [Brucella pituitosa]PJO47948.1 antifreeze protein [Brucella pituitosa]PRA86189.1 antifreeze protein [Ochrobactrum sp. MYb29]
MGSSSGVYLEELVSLADKVLAGVGVIKPDMIATLDTKQGEPVWLALAEHYGCSLRFFAAERLEQETFRIKNPSEAVFATIGCHGVAESAALAAAGPASFLRVEKTLGGRVTAALAVTRV